MLNLTTLKCVVVLLIALPSWPLSAIEVASKTFSGQTFTIITVAPAKESLHLFLTDEYGRFYRRFEQLAAALTAKNKQLVFAMNAGMFQTGFAPLGLYFSDHKQIAPLNTNSGSGNFFWQPNGVFLISRSKPKIIATAEYAKWSVPVTIATQSGPVLVLNNIIHPGFKESSSRRIRNGVGVKGNKALFVISEHSVTFYELASFFREVLHCPDALYLDGNLSSLYLRTPTRNDDRDDLGPIIGVVK